MRIIPENRRRFIYKLGIIVVIFCTAIAFYFFMTWERELRLKWLGEIILTIGVVVTARLYTLLKMTLTEPEAIENILELKDYTLYLRGFSYDKKFSVSNDTSLVDTSEVLLDKIFKPSFIAIGKPNEPLAIPGARRTYLPHDEWKNKVLELIRNAKLIIIRPDVSEGFLWELEQIKSNNFLRKTILYRSIYEDKNFTWEKYLNFLNSTFNVSIPSKAYQFQFMSFNDSGVYYDDRFSFFYDFNQRSWRLLFKNRHRLHLMVDAAIGKIPFWNWSRYFNMAFQMNTFELHLAEINVHFQEMGLKPLEQPKETRGKVVAVFVTITLLIWGAAAILYIIWNILKSLVS